MEKMEERIVMREGDIDDYTHPPSDQTRRDEIYRDDHIIVAVLDEKGRGGAHHLYETRVKNRGHYRALTRVRASIKAILTNSTAPPTRLSLAKVKHRLECFLAGAFSV